jgi:hypothetical protein
MFRYRLHSPDGDDLGEAGGSSLQAKARKVVGDPHATVVSTKTVRALNGEPVTVVVIKPSGSTGLGCIEASGTVSQSVTSSLVPGCPRSSDAYVLSAVIGCGSRAYPCSPPG